MFIFAVFLACDPNSPDTTDMADTAADADSGFGSETQTDSAAEPVELDGGQFLVGLASADLIVGNYTSEPYYWQGLVDVEVDGPVFYLGNFDEVAAETTIHSTAGYSYGMTPTADPLIVLGVVDDFGEFVADFECDDCVGTYHNGEYLPSGVHHDIEMLVWGQFKDADNFSGTFVISRSTTSQDLLGSFVGTAL